MESFSFDGIMQQIMKFGIYKFLASKKTKHFQETNGNFNIFLVSKKFRRNFVSFVVEFEPKWSAIKSKSILFSLFIPGRLTSGEANDTCSVLNANSMTPRIDRKLCSKMNETFFRSFFNFFKYFLIDRECVVMNGLPTNGFQPFNDNWFFRPIDQFAECEGFVTSTNERRERKKD